MNARTKILSAVRRANGAMDGRAAAVEERLRMVRQTAPVPGIAAVEGEEGIARFIEKAEGVAATTRRIASAGEAPAAIADYLRSRNLPLSLRIGADPSLSLDWAGAGVEVSAGAGRLEEPAGLSRAFAGVAETGTLALLSGPDNPVTLTFLPEAHIVMVDAADIEPGFEGLWSRLRAARADPRTVNLVTGPSRTADIEQTLTLGAHGPKDLHILVVG